MRTLLEALAITALIVGTTTVLAIALTPTPDKQSSGPGVVTLRDTYASTPTFQKYRCDELRIKTIAGAPTVFCTQGKYEHVFYGLVPWRVDRAK